MKSIFKSKLLGGLATIAAIAILINVPMVGGQSFSELVGNIYLRSQNPQIRVAGTTSFMNVGGTATAPLAAARPAIVTTSATRTVDDSECGAVIVANATSSTQTFTLPGVANTGCMLTFVAGHADTEILINAAASATCVVTVFAAVGADADTAIVTDASCNTGLKNTAGTNAIGDSLTIVSDGTRWLGVGIASGIWTTQ